MRVDRRIFISPWSTSQISCRWRRPSVEFFDRRLCRLLHIGRQICRKIGHHIDHRVHSTVIWARQLDRPWPSKVMIDGHVSPSNLTERSAHSMDTIDRIHTCRMLALSSCRAFGVALPFWNDLPNNQRNSKINCPQSPLVTTKRIVLICESDFRDGNRSDNR